MRKFCKKAFVSATSDMDDTNRELAGFNQKILFSPVFSGAQTGMRPTTCQNKPETVISISFSYSQNEKCSYFMFHTPRWGTASF